MPLIQLCVLSLLIVEGVSGVEVKSVSVTEGDSITLNTDVTDVQADIQILWLFGPRDLETRIAEIHNQKPMTYVETGRYGDRLKLDSQTGSLIITNITITDSGLYQLEIINSRETSENKFNVTVYAPLPVPVIMRNSSQCSSSSERSSVSKCVLLCSVMNVSHVSLSWYKGKSLLSSINVSDLNIRLSLHLEVEYQDTNTYRCVINNPITNHTQHLHINDVCQPCSELRHHYSILISVLVLLLFIVLSVGVIYCHNNNCGQQLMSDVEAYQAAYTSVVT